MDNRIDHIGIAVQHIDEALTFFQEALGIRLDRIENEEGGRTEVAFLPVDGTEVELVQPHDMDSGLAKFLAKRGEGIHHVCFEVDDIEGALKRLAAHGAELIDREPQTNSRGHRYAFIHPKSAHGVLIELYQK